MAGSKEKQVGCVITWESCGLEEVLERGEGELTRREDSCRSVTRERNERGPFYEKIMMREWGECKGWMENN